MRKAVLIKKIVLTLLVLVLVTFDYLTPRDAQWVVFAIGALFLVALLAPENKGKPVGPTEAHERVG